MESWLNDTIPFTVELFGYRMQMAFLTKLAAALLSLFMYRQLAGAMKAPASANLLNILNSR
jgi:hypothetical protein